MKHDKKENGFTLIEVLVAIAILSIVSAALLSFLPFLTRNTNDADLDARQTQQAISIFEEIASEWSNPGSGGIAETVNGQPVDDYVKSMMGADCNATVSDQPDPSTALTKRVVITCVRGGTLQPLELRAEFGNSLGGS